MSNGREVAYRMVSQSRGPVFAYTHPNTFPVEVLDEDPMYDRFFRTIGQAGTLVLFDKPGTGASDPFDRDRDYLEQVVEAYCCVLDAVEAPAAWLVGAWAPLLAVLTAHSPERLLGGAVLNPNVPLDGSVGPEAIIDRDHDDTELVLPSRADDDAHRAWLLRARRMGASRVDARAFLRALVTSTRRAIDELEPVPDAPPVLLIRRREAIGVEHLDWWNRIFPDAERVTIEGADRVICAPDAGHIAELMAGFMTGRRVTAPVERRLMAVLFTDLVDSTKRASASGDALWRSTLDRYEASLERTIGLHHGTVIKHTGDGALATFPSGSDAVAAAVELRGAARDLGLEDRAGIHVGEIEQRGDDIGGIAVHLAARVMGKAGPSEIIVTSTAAESTFGGQYTFGDLGTQTLKGIDRPWHLFSVEPRN